ncbi:MAG: hypothetical protein ABIQ12_05970 [Opitutaceae bacterium]
MKPTGLIVLSLLAACVSPLRAADATTPVDYTQRNAPFAPAASVSAEKKTPETNSAVQDKRFEKTTVEKKSSSLSERRAPMDIKEAREKNVREKDSRRPEKIDQPTSTYNGRQATISTAADTTKPPVVAKYQDSLAAASATNMARFPALDGATGAKINRFVFRKNPEEQKTIASGAAVTPAAGGAVLSK